MKKIGILALILAVLMCLLTVGAFAGSNKGNSQIPFVDSEQITPQYPEIQTEDDLMEEFERMFGESAKSLLSVILLGIVVSTLFFPCLVVVIVFAVLNSKIKKKISEYKRFFGPVPQNSSAHYNQNYNNTPYYVAQPVNTTNTPMGTQPTGNTYVPESNQNNWQGGQF